MEECAQDGLAEAEDAENSGKVGEGQGCRAQDSGCGVVSVEGGQEHWKREDLAKGEEERQRREKLGCGHTFGGVLAQAVPCVACVGIHAAGRERCEVCEACEVAVLAEETRKQKSVVHRLADGGVSAHFKVGCAAAEKELPAASGVSGAGAARHPTHGKQAQKDEVDQREKEILQQSDRLLERESTDQTGTGLLKERGHAREGFGRESDIGVHKAEEIVRGVLRALPAGVLFAVPACWK